MSVLARSGSVCYPISNAWLREARSSSAPDYVDIVEIRNETLPGYPQSAYLTWVLNNDPFLRSGGANHLTKLDGSALTRDNHRALAKFIDNGIRIGAIADSPTEIGNDVTGVLFNSNYITRQEYAAYINHPERYRRIYRRGTNVENFWFVGFNES